LKKRSAGIVFRTIGRETPAWTGISGRPISSSTESEFTVGRRLERRVAEYGRDADQVDLRMERGEHDRHRVVGARIAIDDQAMALSHLGSIGRRGAAPRCGTEHQYVGDTRCGFTIPAGLLQRSCGPVGRGDEE
jgi:hypothetical protein